MKIFDMDDAIRMGIIRDNPYAACALILEYCVGKGKDEWGEAVNEALAVLGGRPRQSGTKARAMGAE